MNAAPDHVLEYEATITCPTCKREFTGLWVGRKTGAQQCGACGHVFVAAWPGFGIEPESVIIEEPAEEPGRGAA